MTCCDVVNSIVHVVSIRSSPIIDSDDEDDENEGEEWVFPVPEKKSKSQVDVFM